MAYKFRRFRDVVEGKLSLPVRVGEPLRGTMDKERISAEEIASEMRSAGIENLGNVKWAVLESSGRLAIIG